MADITYCAYAACPFADCDRHLNHAKELAKAGKKYISIANFAGTCRRYIEYLVKSLDTTC